MPVDPRIKQLPVSEFTHKQPDVDVLQGSLPLRLVISAASGSGKTLCVANMITRLLTKGGKSCFERVYLWSPTCHLDKTWTVVQEYIENQMGVDTKKEPWCFDEFDEGQMQKIINRHAKVVQHVKDSKKKQIPGILIILDDLSLIHI